MKPAADKTLWSGHSQLTPQQYMDETVWKQHLTYKQWASTLWIESWQVKTIIYSSASSYVNKQLETNNKATILPLNIYPWG